MLISEGQLKVTNSFDSDIIVELVNVLNPTYPQDALYIRSGDSTSFTGIGDGTYNIYYSVGSNYYKEDHRFENAYYKRLDKNFDYTTTDDGQYIHYTVWTWELSPETNYYSTTISLSGWPVIW
jgi:hypothetical protein